MALADSILTGYDPTKVLLQTFGTLAKANSERHQLELLAKKNEQDAILEAAAMELKGRIFQMNLKESGVQMKNTYSLIAERERRTDQANAIADKEEMFNSRLQSLSPDGRSFITILESGTPEEKEAAWDKWNLVKQEFGGFDSDGIRRAVTQIESTTFGKAKMQLAIEKEQARQREAEGKAARDERKVATGEKNAATTADRLKQQGTIVEQVRADRLAKEAERRKGASADTIKLPQSAGGNSISKDEIRRTLGAAAIAGPGTPEFTAAEQLQRRLQTIGTTNPANGKVEPTFMQEDFRQWTIEGRKLIESGAKKRPLGDDLPTDPDSKPAMEQSVMPDEMPSLESLMNRHIKTKKKTSAVGFGGFGIA